ncbi:hypothetical protein B0A55_05593 [Friedmanniomyces simplex]|uniref:Duf1665 domain containing protein n=1 Tax=Friedmanniomyces simplex TaxID=329884 RepID=A0A4U0XFT1_9PEZI|nr:hypothetical protein B0A55_05593 [Friedmanniomyces simplex]
MTSQPTLQRPGFGLPLDAMPRWRTFVDGKPTKPERFPHAISDFFAIEGVTCREQRMLDFINQVTDKPRWWEKVHDEAVLARWRGEACGTEEQQRTSGAHLDGKCFDCCVKELQDKAVYLASHGVVHVLDVAATVVKADVEQTDAFWQALRQDIRPLENVPERLQDWHPSSDGLVLDLLHPSLFPLQYGKSRVLPEGIVSLDRCAEYTGLGDVCPVPEGIDNDYSTDTSWGNHGVLKPWGRYQWLPSEVKLNEDGIASITSYVNNLHPEVHGDLYKTLELAVAKAVPLWNECLSWFHDRLRINVQQCSYGDFIAPTYPGWPDASDIDADDSSDEDAENDIDREPEENWRGECHYQDWLRDNPDERQLLQPSPKGDYIPFEQRLKKSGPRRDLRTDFPDGLQIIFKLANIHLTPSQPTYAGSNWHVEGALNEHICATALFYHDSHNTTDTHLEFQQHIDAEAMVGKPMQHEYEVAEDLYGIKNEEAAVQQLGRVLTREGRWLAFPNVMQHRVAPFRLRDPSRAGHRKILAMFLVDPHIKILSTANVAPQRRDWWADEVRRIAPFSSLPVELFDRIVEVVEDFPVGREEACEVREALMAERGRVTEGYDEMLAQDTFYFCEH